MSLIGTGGLADLSIAGIAELVGIVPSAVYRHFKGKEDVLDMVLELLRVRMRDNVTDVCAETPDAVSRLHLLLERHMAMLIDNPAFPHVIFAHFAQSDHASRWSTLRSTMCSYISEIQQIIEQGQKDGVIRPDISSRPAAVMFIGLILPAAMLHRLSDGEFDPSAHMDAVWPVFVRGVTADEKFSHRAQA